MSLVSGKVRVQITETFDGFYYTGDNFKELEHYCLYRHADIRDCGSRVWTDDGWLYPGWVWIPDTGCWPIEDIAIMIEPLGDN